MGKAKPTKKASSSPLKISTSLFKKKAKRSSVDWSGSDDSRHSMSPSPKKSTKAKSSKTETKPKTIPKKTKASLNSGPSSSGASRSTGKQSKSGAKTKPTPEKKTPVKGKTEKGKTPVKGAAKGKTGKGSKVSPAKPAPKSAKNTKDNRKSPKATKTPVLRKRSQSNSTATSSTSSSSASSTTSSSRTPSPVQSPKPKAKTSTSKVDPKKQLKKRATGKSESSTEKDKDKGKGAKGKKGKPVKVVTAKPKVKPAKPKAKLRRMASLNAKAILEASFNNEGPEKKQRSPAVTPTKVIPKTQSTSTGTTMDNSFHGDLKPLTLLFSGNQPPIPEAKTLSPGGERKRKSSVMKSPPAEPTPDVKDSIAASIENSIAKVVNPGFRRVSTSVGTSTSPPAENKGSFGSGVPLKIKKNDNGKSKSPTPKKKPKVASSSVSTSTSPFEHHDEPTFQPKASSSMTMKRGMESTGTSTSTDRRAFHAPFSVPSNSHHQIHQPNQPHSTSSAKLQKSASSQTKEKANKSSTPVAHFGYQPAGPLIEPHKTVMTGSVPAGLLPDSVRIPADLKVTYQTHPPTTTVLTLSTSSFSSQQSSKGSSTSISTKYASNVVKGQGGVSAVNIKSTKQILHQPYKSTSSSSSSATATATRPIPQVEVQQTVSFATQPGSFAISGTSLSSTAAGFVSQQSQMGGMTIGPSHGLSSGALVPAGNASEAIPAFQPPAVAGPGVYYGYGAGASHSSPFTPSKYPFVAPDYRPSQHSPYPSSFMYTPGTPQPSPGYFMTPFYTPPITPGSNPGSLGFVGGQSRPLLSAHHPSAAAGAAAAYYQSGPPLAHHPASSYYVAGPSLQPSHHSIQPTAPGHAGLSPPNRSSQTACPSTSCPPSSNSSTSSSTISSNNRVNKQPPKRPSPSNASPRQALDLAISKAKTPTPLPTKNSLNRRKDCSTPSIGADPPKTVFSKGVDIVQSQAKQLESAKTFTEQYSLPDDITITPIIMCPGSNAQSAYYGNGLKGSITSAAEKKKRDIVQVIDPRSGISTTIAKHISNNNLRLGSSPSNVSPVKPNNAGNVGKISPDLDVIVIARGNADSAATAAALKRNTNRRQPAAQIRATYQNPSFQQPLVQSFSSPKNFTQRTALSTSAVNNNVRGVTIGPQPTTQPVAAQFPVTNLVQPLPQQILARGENKTNSALMTGVKRKGLSLNECIDGLKMKKKMRILGDTNISVRALVGLDPTGINALSCPVPVLPLTTTDSALSASHLDGMQQKAGRKDNKPRQRKEVRRGSMGRRTTSTESDMGSTIINGPEAVVAASALVVLPLKANGSTAKLPIQFGLGSGGRRTPIIVKNSRESFDNRKRKPLKMKICTVGGKVITRSATQNSKVKTRAKSSATVGQSPGDQGTSKRGPIRNRQVLLRTKKDWNKSDCNTNTAKSTGAKTRPIFPSYFNTVAALSGNGSSTLTTSNNHVILRIPKSSNQAEKGVLISDGARYGYGKLSSGQYQLLEAPMMSTSGNMTLNALKKRAIVKPLSSTVVNNGAIHSMPMANRKALPTYPHPRWSNGWTFEGDSFEARVYLRNDDQPVLRRCYASMRHDGGDVIRPRDCVLLKSGPRKTDLPFVAKVAALWENPLDGEMMFSLLWYYRPEHTEIGRNKEDMLDEIFASKHRDCNSVATIEDRCYVLTYNEYCRYKKRMKQLQEGIPGNIYPPLVPLSTNSAETTMAVSNLAMNIAAAVWSGIEANKAAGPTSEQQPSQCTLSGKVSPEVVFFCRKVYDYRQKRMLKNPS